jgi:hypothetical protein
MKPSLGDRFAVHRASYVRPPVQPLKIDLGLKRMDTFTWRGSSSSLTPSHVKFQEPDHHLLPSR